MVSLSEQNGRRLLDIFKYIFLTEKFCILIHFHKHLFQRVLNDIFGISSEYRLHVNATEPNHNGWWSKWMMS